MFQKNVLLSKMALVGMTQTDLAKALKLNLATLNAKINGQSEFKLSEISQTAAVLNLSGADVLSIFFAEEIA